MPRLAASRPVLIPLTAAWLLIGVPPGAYAAWPHDASTNVALCTAAGSQTDQRIVSDGAGGAIVAWSDQRTGTSDIYAQRINAAGVPMWTSSGVGICTQAAFQSLPYIVADGAGGAFITWQDTRSGGFFDVYAQRVNAAGVPQWTPDGVGICTATGHQNPAGIVLDGAGGAIISWHDARSGTSYDIYAQRVNGAGVPQWTPDGVVLSAAAFDQFNGAMCSDGSGGAIVAWQDSRGTDYDIYAQRVNSAGVPQWTANGVALCTATNSQDGVTMISDGSGGAFVAWRDFRSVSSFDVYAQRVNAAGSNQWGGTSGLAVCAAAGNQQGVALASDGAGGAFLVWNDPRSGVNNDVYAQRMGPAGTALWGTNGTPISVAAIDQLSPSVISDGSGGAFIVWNDSRSGFGYDIYAQRVNAAGATQWTGGDLPICVAANGQHLPVLVADGAGSFITAWYDYRDAVASSDMYAQRVDRFGYLGNPEPSIASVRDVSFDNGGQVKVSWYPSWLDNANDPNLGAYDIYRSVPNSIAEQAVRQGARRLASFAEAPTAGHSFVVSPDAAQLYAWEYVGTVGAAHYLPAYSFIAPTTSDSIATGNPKTIFMVVGRNSGGWFYWLSAPDSGYSVDNLPPMIPAPFTGAYSAGATHLHWGNNSEIDLAGYRLYRGSSSGFIPGPGNLISAQPDTGHADPGPAGSWYKLSAQDSHGNEGVYAVLGPNGTLDTPGSTVSALAFSPPAPNPVRGGGATFRIALPQAARISLTLFDEQGRRVRDLEHGELPAGEHQARWDGRDEAGHAAASGIYFARLQTMGRTLGVRFAVVR